MMSVMAKTKQPRKRAPTEAQQAWEAAIRAAHQTAVFYIDVRGGAQFVVAYDSHDAGKRYGEYRIED